MLTTLKRLLPTFLSLVLIAGISGCGIKLRYQGEDAQATPSPTASTIVSLPPSEAPSDTSSPSPADTISPSPAPAVKLVPFDGTVEHLFFHPIIAYPELAFDGDSKQKGIDGYMVTVGEYAKMLQSIYDNGYILVNWNDVWSEHTDNSGVTRMVKKTLMVPEGKKPLVLSYDDVAYYDYMRANGFPYKLIVKDGQLWSWGLDPNGKEVVSQDLDALTILDKFIRLHPDFSLNGAKGCLCLTGYEGILGYRTMTDVNDTTPEADAARQEGIDAVKPIVAFLKSDGWYFGSHSWGHINLSTASLEAVERDTQRWFDEVGSLVGPTKLMIYPFGARPDGDDVTKEGPIFKYLQSRGFRVFASVGTSSYSKIKMDIDAVICDRMHADGDTLRTQRDRYLKFYDAKLVFDSKVRPDYGVKW
jgi:hypothetical protein